MLRSTSFLRGPAARRVTLAGLCAVSALVLAPTAASAAVAVAHADAIAVERTLPPTGVRVEDAMEAGGVLLAVGTTVLLIRRKRRELR